MWNLSQLISKFNNIRKGTGGSSPRVVASRSDVPNETPASDYSAPIAAPPSIRDTGRESPARLDEELTIQAMYKSWVELESSVTRAHDDLRTILAIRERSADLRKEAEQVLLEGEAIRDEAQHIGESAWQAFDRGFAINPRGLASQCARLREVEEVMKTQAALQRASHREAWDEADKTRQKATADILKVLMALKTAVVQVERELHEAANLPAVAESLKESAQDELRGAEAIRNELAILGREALNLLGPEPGKEERPISGPRQSSFGYDERQVAFAPGPAETPRLEGRTPVFPDLDPQGLLAAAEEGVEAATSVAWEPVETQPSPSGDVDEDVAPQPQPVVEHVEPVPQPAVHQAEAPPPEPLQVIEIPPQSPSGTAADELRREMEAISLSGPIIQEVPPSVSRVPSEELGGPVAGIEPDETLPGGAAQGLIRELEALRSPAGPLEGRASSAAEDLTNELAGLTGVSPSPAPSEQAPPSMRIESQSPGLAPVPEATPGSPDLPRLAAAAAGGDPGPARLEDTPATDPVLVLPQSYTGRFYLMFSATLSQDSLESVWEFLEEVAGIGTIADMRLVSQDAGVQFTMALGAKELMIDELRRRIPNAELVPLGPDRLRVNWSG